MLTFRLFQFSFSGKINTSQGLWQAYFFEKRYIEVIVRSNFIIFLTKNQNFSLNFAKLRTPICPFSQIVHTEIFKLQSKFC